jgi:hypothetical protein
VGIIEHSSSTQGDTCICTVVHTAMCWNSFQLPFESSLPNPCGGKGLDKNR